MEQRIKQWFLTINPNATCYNTFTSLLDADNVSVYAYILHDKDIDEDNNPKESHYHLYLQYNNGRTFSAVQKDFKGAHLEQVRNVSNCIKYLIHATEHSQEDGKHQYTLEEVKTSNTKYVITQLNKLDLDSFDPNEILTYIDEGCESLIAFYKRFGCQINQYTTLIEKLLRDRERLSILAIQRQRNTAFLPSKEVEDVTTEPTEHQPIDTNSIAYVLGEFLNKK